MGFKFLILCVALVQLVTCHFPTIIPGQHLPSKPGLHYAGSHNAYEFPATSQVEANKHVPDTDFPCLLL
jgi:hypothetical protein